MLKLTNPHLWNLVEAVLFAQVVEPLAVQAGAHIALTGGCLYKNGERKDLDIVIYRIRQTTINRNLLFDLLRSAGISIVHDYGFVVKALAADGRSIDFLFPESPGTYYRRRV